MKKQLVFLSIFLFITSTFVDAQVRFGVKAGGNYTNVTNIHRESDSRIGAQIGGLVLIPIDNNDMFFVQPEVVYSMQGEHWRTSNGKYKEFLDYINVPIMAKYYISNLEDEFFLEAGPQFGFKISDNLERLESAESKFKSFDFSLGLGFGYSVNRDFEANLRYNYGLTDVVEKDATDQKNHSSQLSFSVAYIFR